VTVPAPLPLPPALIVAHDALLVAVQLQPIGAVTGTVPVPAVATTLAEAGEIVGVHAAPAWVSEKVLPAMVTVPVRAVTAGFAVAV
jgi:hypothetical protein